MHQTALLNYTQKMPGFSFGLADAERHVFKTGSYPNGQGYTIVQLIEGDQYAAEALSKAIAAEYPNSLKDRTHEDYARLINYNNRFNGKGGMLLGVVQQPDNLLVAFAGIEMMNDESDPGSGPEVFYKGQKNNAIQMHFKTNGVLKAWSRHGHGDELYEARMGIVSQLDRDFVVMKTNNPKLIDKNVARGWINISQDHGAFPELSLVYTRTPTPDDKKIDVLVMPIQKAQEWFAENSTGMTLPKLSIIGHASSAAPVSRYGLH